MFFGKNIFPLEEKKGKSLVVTYCFEIEKRVLTKRINIIQEDFVIKWGHTLQKKEKLPMLCDYLNLLQIVIGCQFDFIL